MRRSAPVISSITTRLLGTTSPTGKAYTYPDGVNFLTHFEGISSPEPGVYTLSADSVQIGASHVTQGSWVVLKPQPHRVVRQVLVGQF